jgi:ferric iron reductase protein FhuF
MIPLLAPLFQGDWAAFGAGLSCAPPPAGAIRLDRLLHEPGRLDAVLRLHARHLGVDDLRPVSTGWLLDYCWMLLPPFAVAATMLHRRLPLAPQQAWLAIDLDGHPERLYLAHDGDAMPDTSTAERYGELLRSHLPPLVAALARHGRVAERLLWGNAARRLDAVFEQILIATGNAGHCAQDAHALLQQPRWADGLPNPLQGPRRIFHQQVGGVATRVELHRECCLCYMLPQDGYCTACPLAPANRSVKQAALRIV